MGFLRQVRADDLDALLGLASKAGAGLTTLPPDRDTLARKVELSLKSFASKVQEPGDEYYLFVLEDEETGKVFGTSGIFGTVGLRQPFYNYRLLKLTQVSHEPEKTVNTELLQLVNDYAGASELATLFLDKDHRSGGNGTLLSRSRYLFIAAHPERFSERIMAEIRGWTDEKGRSPFWEAIGRRFFNMDFMEADRINGLGNQQFIADLMPKFPIYANLLPQEAQAVIGKTHDNARAAAQLLKNEGFRFAGAIDIFDGGPCLEAPRDQIWSVRYSRALPVHIKASVEGESQIIANPEISKMRMTRAAVQLGADQVTIAEKTARILDVTSGDRVMIAPPRPTR